MKLEEIIRDQQLINYNMMEILNNISNDWGIEIISFRIQELNFNENLKKLLNMEVELNKKREADLTINEAKRITIINQATIKKNELVLKSEGEAERILFEGNALSNRIDSLNNVEKKIEDNLALDFMLSHKYVNIFENSDKNPNNIVLTDFDEPKNMLDKSQELLNKKIELPKNE